MLSIYTRNRKESSSGKNVKKTVSKVISTLRLMVKAKTRKIRIEISLKIGNIPKMKFEW